MTPSRDQQTEKATPRRIQKAREKGNYPSAPLLISSLQLLLFIFILQTTGSRSVMKLAEMIAALFQSELTGLQGPDTLLNIFGRTFYAMLWPAAGLAACLFAATLSAQLVITRFGFALNKLAVDPERLNPLNRLRDLPGQNISSALQTLVLLPMFGWALFTVLRQDLGRQLRFPLAGTRLGLAMTGTTVLSFLWKGSWLFLILGVLDAVRQWRKYQRGLRMSKQEVRDEMKEVEGNPATRSRVRRLRRDLARRHMMREVPTATTVVVNPTHYAVALRYSLSNPGAPRVVAKGKNYLAARIRQIAVDNDVPLVENAALAQGLYKFVEVGQEIPAKFYQAVAEVLAYVYRSVNGRVLG